MVIDERRELQRQKTEVGMIQVSEAPYKLPLHETNISGSRTFMINKQLSPS
jgi:hypothetical protein